MGESNSSRIAKNTILLYIRSFFVLVVSLYTSRVVLRELGVEDYGIFNVVGGVIGMLAFIRSTMQSTYQRFFNFAMGEGDDNKLILLFKSSLSVQVLFSIIIIILAETIGLWFVDTQLVIPTERHLAALWVYQFTIVSCILTIMSTPFCAVITAYEKMGVFAVISIFDAVAKLLICYLISISPIDKLIFYSILLGAIHLMDLILYVLYSVKAFSVVSFRLDWSPKNLRDMLSFSGWSVIDTLSGTLKTQGLSILLNLFFGPIVNAARGVASQVLNAVMQFTHSFQTAFRPQIIKSYASGDFKYLEKLYYSTTKISFYLMFILSLPLLLETPFILDLWLGSNVPDHAVSFTRIVLVTAWMGAFANPTSTVAFATGKIKTFSTTASLFNLSILPLAYMVLFFGGNPEAALLVSLVIAILTQYIRLIVVKKLIGFKISTYIKIVVFPILLSCALSVPLPLLLRIFVDQGLHRLIYSLMICTSSCCISFYLVGLNIQEKQLINGRIRHIIARIRKR